MVDKPKTYPTAGRPRNAENKAEVKTPKTPIPKMTGELPKEIIGSHMGSLHPVKTVAGPAIKNPIKPAKSPKKAPPK